MTKTKERERAEVEPPKRRHRVFPWVFLGVQIIFLVWIITGANSGGDCPAGQQNACDAGTTIGVGLIIGLWVAVDIILALTYLMFRVFRK
ncbi:MULTISPECIES: hypothetical protein [Actinomadura]|jgi:hypothetical protein|uniref:Uncharacterized protein n=1 Tax=Actinomadura montaniterrae TaxID=1803903 RepID=A0A6L3VTL6_9ACTN|nr:hypothetical protein [Actinomadura montaniterrae]KAB2379003.1 hypothetical protein F9B16_22380 [Actinomadura montaniterrae]